MHENRVKHHMYRCKSIAKCIIINIVLLATFAFAQDSTSSKIDNRSPGSIRLECGFGNILGERVGVGINLKNRWLIEGSYGIKSNFSFGGPSYKMTIYGWSINKYFKLHQNMDFLTSIIYSYSKIKLPSNEYLGNFSLISPVIGFDYASNSGFGYFIRFGLLFGTENYNKSNKFSIDIVLCWQIN